MEIHKILLPLCSWLVMVQTQTQNQYARNQFPINPDQIYFEENRPHVIRNVPSDNDNQRNNNIVIQDHRGNINYGQDSYLQRVLAANPGQYANNNNRGSHAPSIKLEPPIYNTDGSPNYYSTAKYTFNTSEPKDVHVQLQNVPLNNNVSRAITSFGLNLLKNIVQRSGNVVISPYSIATLLALLQEGALGSTQQEIMMALQMRPETATEGFKHFNSIFQKRSSRNILKVANNVYVADAFDLNPTFKKVATRHFGSEVTPIMFARPEQAVREINDWVAANTNNKIQDLLTPNAVGDNSQLVLVNAVYFKGLWQVKFKPESTMPREFHFSDGRTKSMQFMRMRGLFKAGVDRSNNAHIIILPFENEQYSLVIALPSQLGDLDALVSSLTDNQLAAYHDFTPKEVELEIPKFTVRGDTELNEVLRKMGITHIFSEQAELSGIGTYRTYSPQVSSALHTAMLSIDEYGGSAAAATAFAVIALSYDDPSIIFNANRPFFAVLWDNQLALPLFMAKIEDPNA